MSWDHDTYAATCANCGAKGTVTISMDDWNQTKTRWSGFDNVDPHSTAVGMKHLGAHDSRPECQCGNTKIVRGERISES